VDDGRQEAAHGLRELVQLLVQGLALADAEAPEADDEAFEEVGRSHRRWS